MGRIMDLFFNKYNYTDFHELNLDWIINVIKELIDAVYTLEGWKAQHEEEYQELKEICDNLQNGTLTPALQESLRIWINNNLESLIGDAIKTVHFGLTNDGYFCAFIPASWSGVVFDTIMDFNDPLYGHLVLKYD